MNSELLHISLLAACGNACLAGRDRDAPFPSAGFELHTIQFLSSGNDMFHSEADWFSWLKGRNCRELALAFESDDEDYNRTAFANGVANWGIGCLYDGRSELWSRYWNSSLVDGAYRWDVIYRELQTGLYRDAPDKYDLPTRFTQLRSLAGTLASLSDALKCGEWKSRFGGLFETMDYFHRRKLLEGSQLPGVYSEEARMLFSAACQAWVFGGIGSWNDGPPGLAAQAGMENTYMDLTNELYKSILFCLKSAVGMENIE